MDVNQYNSEVDIRNAKVKEDAERVFAEYGAEKLSAMCITEEELSYTKEGLFFDKTYKYINNTINFKHKLPKPLNIIHSSVFGDCVVNGGVVSLHTGVYYGYVYSGEKGKHTFDIGYVIDHHRTLPTPNLDKELLSLEKKVKCLVESGATEVVLEDCDIAVLSRWV